MPVTGLIYRNIHWYRFFMNLLYLGGYKKRFSPLLAILEKVQPKSVVEFCFGDVVIASWCRKRDIAWKGIDLNDSFVRHAVKKGFDARQADLLTLQDYPVSDAAVISGSLYHFTRQELKDFLIRVFRATDVLIVSEPVENLSSSGGVIGYAAGKSTQTSREESTFRYNRQSLIETMNTLAGELHLKVGVDSTFKKDLILTLSRFKEVPELTDTERPTK